MNNIAERIAHLRDQYDCLVSQEIKKKFFFLLHSVSSLQDKNEQERVLTLLEEDLKNRDI